MAATRPVEVFTAGCPVCDHTTELVKMTARPSTIRIRSVRLAAVVGAVMSLVADVAAAGPITFLTALPVPQGQGVIRGQFVFVRASDDPTDAARELTVTAVPVAAAVGVTPRLAIFGIVPIVKKSMTAESPTGRTTRGATGLGDAVAFARYTVYAADTPNSTFRIASFAGFETPTGRTDASDAVGRLPRALQPGSGSWDPLAGVAVTLQTKPWELDADVGYKRNTQADGVRFGDELFADVSFQYRVWPRDLGSGVPAFLYAVVETNLFAQGRSEHAGARDPDSGGRRWDVDLGLQYVTTRVIVEGIVQIPVVDKPHGTGLRSDVRLTAGVRWNVALPF
ncbi:MAG: transporter [Acidobacteriota bacterium]